MTWSHVLRAWEPRSVPLSCGGRRGEGRGRGDNNAHLTSAVGTKRAAVTAPGVAAALCEDALSRFRYPAPRQRLPRLRSWSFCQRCRRSICSPASWGAVRGARGPSPRAVTTSQLRLGSSRAHRPIAGSSGARGAVVPPGAPGRIRLRAFSILHAAAVT